MQSMLAMLLAIVMVLSLAACGETKSAPSETAKETPTHSVAPGRSPDANDLESVLDDVTNDFADVIAQLTGKLTETFTSVGDTYEDYQKNKGLVDEWIALVLSESDLLFARTKEHSITYFKSIAADEDHKYSEFCDELLDEYYDVVYDDALDEYYDTLYDDAMDDIYDEYYDGIIDDAEDELDYKEWSTARSECYKTWSNARSEIYKKWSGERSYIYGLWSAVRSAFCYDDNYDVDAIVAECDKEAAKKAEEEAKVYVDFEAIYEINADGNAEVVGFSGDGNRITISSKYQGKDVVRIADSAFKDCTALESIILWAELEEIGNSAFKGCTGLTEFSVPSDTTLIGHNAFEGCTNLETLIIWGDPDIGEYAFADCISLTNISIGRDTKNVGAHAFEGCTGVTSLIIWGVEIIGDYAFSGCTGIESVSIPRDVLSVGNHAFDGCTALSSVIVWDNDTAIGKDAFANCPNLDDAPAARGTVLECTMSKSESSGNDKETELNEPTQNKDTETATDGIRPEFKEAMDSYEAFYTEYCEFMKEYSENPTDLTLLINYTDMLVKAEEMNEAFEEWDEDELNDEELKYYLDVNNRVAKMLIDIAD